MTDIQKMWLCVVATGFCAGFGLGFLLGVLP